MTFRDSFSDAGVDNLSVADDFQHTPGRVEEREAQVVSLRRGAGIPSKGVGGPRELLGSAADDSLQACRKSTQSAKVDINIHIYTYIYIVTPHRASRRRVEGVRFRVSGLGSGFERLRFRVECLGFRVEGLRVRVLGLWPRGGGWRARGRCGLRDTTVRG